MKITKKELERLQKAKTTKQAEKILQEIEDKEIDDALNQMAETIEKWSKR